MKRTSWSKATSRSENAECGALVHCTSHEATPEPSEHKTSRKICLVQERQVALVHSFDRWPTSRLFESELKFQKSHDRVQCFHVACCQGHFRLLGIWKQAGTYCAFGFSRPSGWRKLIKHDKHINGFPIFCIYQRLCGAIAKLPPSQGLSSRSMIVKQQSGRWPAPWQQGCRDVGVLLWTEHGEFWKISGELLWYMECTNGVQAEVHMLRQDLWEAGTLEQGSCMSEI